MSFAKVLLMNAASDVQLDRTQNINHCWLSTQNKEEEVCACHSEVAKVLFKLLAEHMKQRIGNVVVHELCYAQRCVERSGGACVCTATASRRVERGGARVCTATA